MLNVRQIVLFTHAIVVLAECGRNVNDAGAVFKSYVAVVDDIVAFFTFKVGTVKRFVFHALVLAALFAFQNGVVFKISGSKRFGKHIFFAFPLYRYIVVIGTHTKRDVAGKRPRRSSPGENILVAALDFEFCYRRFFFDVLIALSNLMRRKRRSAARAVRDYFIALVQQSFFPDGFYSPPFRLDIIVVVGNVRMFHIRPVSNAVGHFFPFGFIFPDAFLAFAYKLLDAVLFDFLLAVYSERFFHFQFDGQTVSVPTGFTRAMISLHGFVSGNYILDNACENVSHVRLSVCRRRSVVESKFLSRTVVFFVCLFDYSVLFPEFENFGFAFDSALFAAGFIVHYCLRYAFLPAISP